MNIERRLKFGPDRFSDISDHDAFHQLMEKFDAVGGIPFEVPTEDDNED